MSNYHKHALTRKVVENRKLHDEVQELRREVRMLRVQIEGIASERDWMHRMIQKIIKDGI